MATRTAGPRQYPLHGFSLVGAASALAFQALLHLLVLPHHFPPAHGLVDGQQDLLLAKRLGDEVKGPLGHGLFRGFQGAVGGDYQDQGVFVVFPGPRQQFHAVQARHLQVAEDQVKLLFLQELRRLHGVVGHHHLVLGIAFNDHLEQGQHIKFVVHSQNASHA
jgi:hypothetical protein